MTSQFNWDQFEPIDEESPETKQQEQVDWSDFEAVEEEPKEEKKELSWIDRNFTSEGQALQAAENRNLAKGVAYGLSAGFSELIPGLEVDKDLAKGTPGKIVGSLLPIGWLAKGIGIPLQAAAKLAPKFVKPLTSLGNLLGLSTAGGIYNSLEESAEKSLEAGEFVPPDPETILNEGAKWAALDIALNAAGFVGRFSRELFKESAATGKPVMEVLNGVISKLGNVSGDKVAEKAISVLEDKPIAEVRNEIKQAKDISKTEKLASEEFGSRKEVTPQDLKTRKVEKQEFDKLDQGVEQNSESYLPKEFETQNVINEVVNEDLSNRVESVSRRAPTEKQLGENIKSDIEAGLESSKKETDALYDIAAEVEDSVIPNVQKTVTSVVDNIKKIQKGNLKLTPEGYKKAEADLVKTMNDLGYEPIIDEAGNISGAAKVKDIPQSQAIEVKKRLNKIINYDLMETSAQDFLKNPAALLRQDIRVGYGTNTQARQAFEEAESQFGKQAEKSGKKSITKIRHTESPESIVKIAKTPSGLADIKEVVSPEQFAQIERELLEHLKTLPEEKAASFYREIRPSLSSDTRSIAEEMIQQKAPPSSPTRKQAQRSKIKESIYDDISKSIETGERPKKTLNLWKTKEGQQLVKDALKDSPNKEEVVKYLTDQSFQDFTKSIVYPEGKVDFKKLDGMLKQEGTLDNIRMVAGEEGVAFMKNLETLSNRIKKNKDILEKSIQNASPSQVERMNQEIDRLWEKRLEGRRKPAKVGEERFGKKSSKERKETEKSLNDRGKERIKRSREAREKMTADEKAAYDQAEKNSLLYKIDDFFSSAWGHKTKGVLSVLGVYSIGVVETAAAGLAIKGLKTLSQNKTAREAFKRAAAPHKDVTTFIQSLQQVDDQLDEE